MSSGSKWLVGADGDIWSDESDAQYHPNGGVLQEFSEERAAVEAAHAIRKQRLEAEQRRVTQIEERLRKLGPKYTVGMQVLVEGLEGVLVQVDREDHIYPYQVFFPSSDQSDWYHDYEVSPLKVTEGA